MRSYQEIEEKIKKYNAVEGLMKYFTFDSLCNIHRKMNKKKATGIDDINKEKYEVNLYENINNLLNKMKMFEYYPNPVKRVSIPKSNGKVRNLGLPSYEDKLVQAQMAEILNAIYDPLFRDCSYGFRPYRSGHDALNEIRWIIKSGEVKYVLDADIKGFFDNLNQEMLMEMLKGTIKDKHFMEYIKRFLEAGIMVNEQYIESDKGVPQGGIISPILANVYLHYILDSWFEDKVKGELKGKSYLIRYADDFVILFQYRKDSELVYKKLEGRLRQYKLELSKEKTSIIRFKMNVLDKSNINFLGINISKYIDREGNIKIAYKISKGKIAKRFDDIRECIKNEKKLTLDAVIKELNSKLRGYYEYYGYSTNIQWLNSIYIFTVKELLRKYMGGVKCTFRDLIKIAELLRIERPRVKHYV